MKITFLALASVILCGCVAQTPQTRIQNNPALFQTLSKPHQELAQQGKIAKGMPSAGVFLALGNPSRRSEGHRNGKDFQRWDYTSLQPVIHHNFHFGYGRGYHRYRHHRHHFGVGHSIDYLPYRSRSVWFTGDRVDSWEFFSQPY